MEPRLAASQSVLAGALLPRVLGARTASARVVTGSDLHTFLRNGAATRIHRDEA